MLDRESEPDGIVSSVAVDGDRATVVLRGEIDIATADDLRRCLMGCLSAGCGSLTVDMTAVRFLDSSGLRILVEAARRAQAGLTLVNPSRMVRRLVEITGLHELLTMVPPGDRSNGHSSHGANGRRKGED